MAIDDRPFDALERHFELEDSSRSPAVSYFWDWASRVIPFWPFDKAAALLKDRFAADGQARIKIMLETVKSEVRKHEEAITALQKSTSTEALETRELLTKDLLPEAARRAFITRDEKRVVRIGLILANAVIEPQPDSADEIEEMMRIAMDLNDNDARYLRELDRIEGTQVRANGRISRPNAFSVWPNGFWGQRVLSELDSTFSKLEGFGLVSRLAPPNNLNATADIQNRYALLLKGTRFIDLIRQL